MLIRHGAHVLADLVLGRPAEADSGDFQWLHFTITVRLSAVTLNTFSSDLVLKSSQPELHSNKIHLSIRVIDYNEPDD